MGCQAPADNSSGNDNDNNGQPSQQTYQLKIAGGGPGSTVYLAAGAISEYIKSRANIPNLASTAQASGGFLENARLVEKGETDMGITASSMLFEASKSTGAFANEQPYTNTRVLFPIWWGATHWLTYNDSIKTVADLKGKRVNVGPPGSSAITYSEVSLRAANLWDDVKKESQSWDEGNRMMQDGLIDAFSVTGPPPFPAAQEAALVPGKKLKFIKFDEATMTNVFAQHPELDKMIIKKDIYGEGCPAEDYETFGYIAWVTANKDTPDWVVYEVMKAMLSDDGRKFMVDNVNTIETGLDILPGFKEAEAAGLKMHPGAIQYWKELGQEVPQALIP